MEKNVGRCDNIFEGRYGDSPTFEAKGIAVANHDVFEISSAGLVPRELVRVFHDGAV